MSSLLTRKENLRLAKKSYFNKNVRNERLFVFGLLLMLLSIAGRPRSFTRADMKPESRPVQRVAHAFRRSIQRSYTKLCVLNNGILKYL